MVLRAVLYYYATRNVWGGGCLGAEIFEKLVEQAMTIGHRLRYINSFPHKKDVANTNTPDLQTGIMITKSIHIIFIIILF